MPIRRFRVSLSTMMMIVLIAAAGAALFAKASEHTGNPALAGLRTNAPTLLLLAFGLTTVALGSWKSHTPVPMMLQGTLACLGCLTLIWFSEAKMEATDSRRCSRQAWWRR